MNLFNTSMERNLAASRRVADGMRKRHQSKNGVILKEGCQLTSTEATET